MWSSFTAIYQRSFNKGSGNKVFILTVLPRLKGFKAIAVNNVIGNKDY